jgi:hypothetical protein
LRDKNQGGYAIKIGGRINKEEPINIRNRYIKKDG